MKIALERLGYGPCFHMSDVMRDASRAKAWLDAANSADPDLTSLLAGFTSTMDWPAAAFWRELLDAYPQAKAILTVRDPQRWYDSMENTILRAWRSRGERTGQATDTGPARVVDSSDFGAMTQAVVRRRVFDGRLDDRAYAIETFERHSAEVRAAVPADRLLSYQVSQGWEPLCTFLDVPVPAEPFPWENDTATFIQRLSMNP
jgi:hypothetical protein